MNPPVLISNFVLSLEYILRNRSQNKGLQKMSTTFAEFDLYAYAVVFVTGG